MFYFSHNSHPKFQIVKNNERWTSITKLIEQQQQQGNSKTHWILLYISCVPFRYGKCAYKLTRDRFICLDLISLYFYWVCCVLCAVFVYVVSDVRCAFLEFFFLLFFHSTIVWLQFVIFFLLFLILYFSGGFCFWLLVYNRQAIEKESFTLIFNHASVAVILNFLFVVHSVVFPNSLLMLFNGSFICSGHWINCTRTDMYMMFDACFDLRNYQIQLNWFFVVVVVVFDIYLLS